VRGRAGGGGQVPPPPDAPPQVHELERTFAVLRMLINERPDRDPLVGTARALLDARTAVLRLHHPVTVPHHDGARVV